MFAGLTGAHHFYMERLVHGTLCFWTLNFLFMGFFIDALVMPVYLRVANRGKADFATGDGTGLRILMRLPLTVVLICAVISLTFIGVPRGLRSWGVVDADQLGAKTSQNPYDLLGLPHGADALAVEAAYQERSARFVGQRRCDAECRAQLADLKQAYKYAKDRPWAKGRGARARKGCKGPRCGLKPSSGDEASVDPWQDLGDYRLFEWRVIMEELLRRLQEWAKPVFDSSEGPQGAPDPHG